MREHIFFPNPSFPHYSCYPDFIGGYQNHASHTVDRPAQSSDFKLNQLYNLHFIVKGKGYVYSQGTKYELSAGHGFLYGPELAQRYQADPSDPWDIRWVHFSASALESLLGNRGISEVWLFEHHHIETLNQRMDDLLSLGRNFDLQQEIRASAILYEMLLHMSKEAVSLHLPKDPSLPGIHAAANYMREHCTQSISITEIATFTGYSVPYFSRKFHQSMGVTPTAYLLESRILHAKKLLLSTNKTIQDIAVESGFSQSSYFIHCFKKVVDLTPEQFRLSWDS
ncbi:AraC family transcriptional regulator [Paenibacillus sp. PK4536]|uniref:AraC family transcriptional regulator n=1 Tax=Paenibacillus TaxID=44249 RepID=UPI002359E192|nr:MULTISPECIES: AraC family transcriptional regulator [Paenibacillus]WIM38399.1 AraC family transcriptional regulator [Paenibacillus sp. PK4536]CAJ1314912.1 Msm operon regulatory protein [Paenibacillus nuruki]